jgi:hypothetical protein
MGERTRPEKKHLSTQPKGFRQSDIGGRHKMLYKSPQPYRKLLPSSHSRGTNFLTFVMLDFPFSLHEWNAQRCLHVSLQKSSQGEAIVTQQKALLVDKYFDT